METAFSAKPQLIELDHWMLSELPSVLSSRNPVFMTQAELSKLMKWKLMKGKWRPRLQQFVDGLGEDLVTSTTWAAFKLAGAGKPLRALEALCELKGVGPATASAILSALHFDLPFMSDEAMNACLSAREYTVPAFEALHAELSHRAQLANAAVASGTGASGDSVVGTGSAAGATSGDAGGASAGAGSGSAVEASPAVADDAGPGSRKRQRAGSAGVVATPTAGPEYPVFQGPVTAQRVQLSLYLEAIKAKHGVA